MSLPTLRTLPPAFGRSDAQTLLSRAVDLLRLVVSKVPQSELGPDTYVRINALVADVSGAPIDPAEAATVTERPRLRAVTLTLKQYTVLERAMRSERLSGTFADLHDFILAAGRGYAYASPPEFTHVQVPPKALGVRTIAFKGSELDDLQARAGEAGTSSVEAFITGCAFNWLAALQDKWPNDADLNASRVPLRVDVMTFPPK